MIKSKYLLLNDGNWLEQEYSKQGTTTRGLASIVGCSQGSVYLALKRHGIPIRQGGECHTKGRKEDGFVLNLPVLNGCLLGDGWMRVWNKHNPLSMPYFAKCNKFRDHVEYVEKLLFESVTSRVVPIGEHAFEFRSLTHPYLRPLFEIWYPESQDFKKVIPDNIEVTPTTLLHWFLDDGTSYSRSRKSRQVVVTFCSESFSKSDQENLCATVNDQFDLGMRVFPYRAGWRIRIPQSQADKFFEIIGPPPVQSLAYKWK